MIQKRFSLAETGVVVLALIIGGCTSLSSEVAEETEEGAYVVGEPSVQEAEVLGLPTAANMRFDDVPIPDGLILNHPKSFIFENQEQRIGYLVYEGRVPQDQVIQFFLENVPQKGWNLVDVFEHDTTALTFEADRARLVIRVIPDGKNCISEVYLTPGKANRMSPSPATSAFGR
jgi:hypothetical protein